MLHKNKKIIFVVFFNLMLFSSLVASEKIKNFAYHGFSGGMFLHAGYIKGKSFTTYFPQNDLISTQQVKGLTLGIGGKLALHFGEHWRFGVEGYASGARYGNNRSAFRIGWGGLLAEYTYRFNRFIPFVGLTVGGGGAKNMILLEATRHDFVSLPVIYREYGFPIINPALGCEYLLTSKLKLVLKADYMLSPTKEVDFATGVRVYIGVLFNTMR